MLKLPADLQLAIISESRTAYSAGLTCKQLHRLLNTPESLLRLYLASKRRSKANLQLHWHSNSLKRLSVTQLQPSTCTAPPRVNSDSSSNSNALQLVYGLLTWNRLRSWARTEDGALRTLQLMCECAIAVRAVPEQQQQHALKVWQSRVGRSADSTASDVAAGIELLQQQLPYAEHCLLPYCAAGGHVHLVKALLPRTHSPVLMQEPVVHYVKTSAFFAAAAGGRAEVLSELLSCGALQWACQLPGASLTRTALDLAAQGGHLPVLKTLKKWVDRPNSTFLTAAADSGSGAVMEWALGFWFSQFSAVTGFSTAHVQQMHDALRVSCEAGHLAAIRQLLRHLHAVRCYGSCVLALSYTCATSNTEALACVLESPYLPQQLERGGPKSLERLVMVTASCLRIAIRVHNQQSLELLLSALETPSSPLRPVRDLLGPQMPSIFDQAATAGNAVALQLLLTRLPEHYAALGLAALEGALAEGHTQLAQTIRTLLIMRGSDEGYTPEALSAQHNPHVACAERRGQLKAASSRGDVAALQQLLAGQADPEGAQAAIGPNDNEQLLMLRLAAAAGHEEAVRFLLHEFGVAAGGQRAELCLCAVVRGAVHAGQVHLLQSLECDPSMMLQQHLAQADAISEYSRAALLCGQVSVAAWLVSVAARQQLLSVFRSTLASWLTASRWDLWNTGVARSARDAAAALLTGLASAQPPSAPAATAAAATAAAATGTSDVPNIAPSATAEAAQGSVDVTDGTGEHTDRRSTAPPAPAAAAGVSAAHEQHEPLLNPQVLSLLLQAAGGDPAMLFSVVDLVHSSWGMQGMKQQLGLTQRAQLLQQVQLCRGNCSSSGSQQADMHMFLQQREQQQQQQDNLQLCAADPLADVVPQLAAPLQPGRDSNSSSSSSYNSVPSSSSSSSFSALYGDDRHQVGSKSSNTCCSPGSQAGGPESQARAGPESRTGLRSLTISWPTAFGASKSEVLLGSGRSAHRMSNDVLCSDQQQLQGVKYSNHSKQCSQQVDSFQRLGMDVGSSIPVDGTASSSSSSGSNSSSIKGKLRPMGSVYNNAVVGAEAVGSPVCHPVHTPHKLQQAAEKSPLAGQQQQQQCSQLSQNRGICSLKQLTGGVEKLSVTCADTGNIVQQQQQQGQARVLADAKSLDSSTACWRPPVALRTAVSVPLPKSKQGPLHPYMQYYQQQQRQQQQKQQKQQEAVAVVVDARAGAGSSSSTSRVLQASM